MKGKDMRINYFIGELDRPSAIMDEDCGGAYLHIVRVVVGDTEVVHGGGCVVPLGGGDMAGGGCRERLEGLTRLQVGGPDPALGGWVVERVAVGGYYVG